MYGVVTQIIGVTQTNPEKPSFELQPLGLFVVSKVLKSG